MIGRLFNDGWTFEKAADGMSFMTGQKPDAFPVMLPHDATIGEMRSPDAVGGRSMGFWPSGAYVYRKKFDVPDACAGKEIALQFEGVYREAKVYVNGSFAGSHYNGYTEFTVPIGHLLKYGGENEISVNVRTGKDSRWYAGAGIYRNVRLYVGETAHISPDGVRLTTVSCDEQVAAVTAQVEIVNRAAADRFLEMEIIMTDAHGQTACQDTQVLHIRGNESGQYMARLYIKNPLLWNVDTPWLYTVNVQLKEKGKVLDTAKVESFGIRCLTLDHVRGLAINGRTVKLYGGCIHHDNGVIGAATIERAEERRIRLLKAAGYNAVRSAHHPMSRALLNACDKYGVLVMDELTDMWNDPKNPDDYSTHFQACWRADLASMVRKDYNHPSVVMYSCGNEITEVGTAAGAATMRRLSQEFHRLDATRYTTAGTNNLLACMDHMQEIMQTLMAGQADADGGSGRTESEAIPGEINTVMADMGEMMKLAQTLPQVMEATNESYEALDVAGYNYAETRYATDRKKYTNWISVGSETFPKDLAANWKLCLENSDVIGDFSWTSWDYLGEAGIGKYAFKDSKMEDNGIYGGYPYRLAWDADFDITGEKTPQGYYREIVIGNRTQPFIGVQDPGLYERQPVISSWSWTSHVSSWTWKGFEGKPIRVEVYSKADEVELLINGRSVGRQAVPRETANGVLAYFNVFDTIYEPGKAEAIVYTNGAETGRYEIHTASEDVHVAPQADRCRLASDGRDLAYIDIYLKDENDRINTDSDRKVWVTVEGPGVLLGLGTGAPDSEESFCTGACTTFAGHALAVIRPMAPGTLRVTIGGEGCPEQVILLNAEDI